MRDNDQPATLFWIDENLRDRSRLFESEENARAAASRLSAFERCGAFIQTDAEYIQLK